MDLMRVYSASKILAEDAGRQFRETFGLEYTALRFASIYGPGKRARHGPIGVHTRMIENALLGVATEVDSGGDERDDMIYVKDAAAGIVAACEVEALPSIAYNISTGRTVTLRDFADAVSAAIPGADTRIGPGGDYLGFGDVYGALDPGLARSELGFQAAYDLVEGVKDFVAEIDHLCLRPQAQLEQSTWASGSSMGGS